LRRAGRYAGDDVRDPYRASRAAQSGGDDGPARRGLSFYSVIAGWTLAYIVKSATGVFTGADAATVGAQFDGFVGDWRAVAPSATPCSWA
jgi:hypothetical protein